MNIVVIGAGLGGLVAALGLANLDGVSVEIIEKDKDFTTKRGATIGIAPNGRKALHDILGESFVQNLVNEGISITNSSCVCPWWKVRDMLVELAEKNDKIKIHQGCMLDSFVDEEDGPVKLSCTKSGAPFNVAGDIMIGADGVNSSVRHCLGLPKAEASGNTAWRGCLYLDNFSDDNEHAAFLKPFLNQGICPIGFKKVNDCLLILFNHHPKPAGLLVWHISTQAQVDKGSHPSSILGDLPDLGSEDEKIINAIYALANQDDLNRPIPLKTINPHTWGGSGRVTLLGDSAHAVRPATGLGASLAFEDSVVLLRSLRNAKRDPESLKAALRNFEKERLERVQKIYKNEWEIAEKNFKHGSNGSQSSQELKKYKDWVYAGV